MRDLAVYTENAKLFYRLANILKREGIPWKGLDKFSDIHSLNTLLITTRSDLDKYSPKLHHSLPTLTLNPLFDDTQLLLSVLQARLGVDNPRVLTIAIDPGSKITGIAVFLDRFCIYSANFYDSRSLIKFIKSVLEAYEDIAQLLKLGTGHRRLTRNYLNLLHNNFYKKYCQRLNIILINETHTSALKTHPSNISKHENAAIEIGRRKGRMLKNW